MFARSSSRPVLAKNEDARLIAVDGGQPQKATPNQRQPIATTSRTDHRLNDVLPGVMLIGCSVEVKVVVTTPNPTPPVSDSIPATKLDGSLRRLAIVLVLIVVALGLTLLMVKLAGPQGARDLLAAWLQIISR